MTEEEKDEIRETMKTWGEACIENDTYPMLVIGSTKIYENDKRFGINMWQIKPFSRELLKEVLEYILGNLK